MHPSGAAVNACPDPLHRLLAIAALAGSALCAAVSHGQIAFDPPISIVLPTEHVPTTLVPGDLDGDGLIDLAIPGRSVDGLLYILKATPEGGFLAPEAIEIGVPTDDGVVHDADGDGIADLLLAARTQLGKLVSLRGLGGGSFAAPTFTALEREPRDLALADFDADGDADLAAVNYGSGSISTLEIANGVPAVVDHRTIGRESRAICFPQETHAGDLDGDGRPELVVPTIGNGRLQILRFTEGSLAVPDPVGIRTPLVGDQRTAITTGELVDLDGDGDLDALTPTILLGLPQAIVLYRNDGTGNLLDRHVVTSSFIGYAWCAAAADFDADGRVDLVAGMALPGMLTVLRNESVGLPEGDLTYAFPPMAIFEGGFIRDLLPIDFDRDGRIDLAAVDIATHTIHLFRNRSGEGGLAGLDAKPAKGPHVGPATVAPATRPDVRTPTLQPTADRNRDGRVDAADLAIELAAWDGSALGDRRREGSR